MASAYCPPQTDLAQQQQQQQQPYSPVQGVLASGSSCAPTFNFNVNQQMPMHDGTTGMFFDQMGDPGTEHMIMQLQNAVRSVCDLARASAFHNNNAKDAFSQVRALQAQVMSQMPPSVPPPPRVLHGPPHPSHRNSGNGGGFHQHHGNQRGHHGHGPYAR